VWTSHRLWAKPLKDVHVLCVAINDDGSPGHPLYRRVGCLLRWKCPRAVP
jgi:hypothetical protein